MVNRYVGTPFLAGGRQHGGLDCWGLVRLVLLEEFGIDVPAYGGLPCSVAEPIEREIDGWINIEVGRARPGDVLWLRTGARTDHVGIIARRGRMLHTTPRTGVVLERYEAPPWWPGRIVGVYRHPDLR